MVLAFFDDETTSRKAFSQRDRMLVWDNEFGNQVDRTKCPVCKKNEIRRHHFAIGHKRALTKGGSNSIRNIRAICHQCNSEMGTMSMAEYIKKYHPKSSKPVKKTTKEGKSSISKKSSAKTTKRKKKKVFGGFFDDVKIY